MGAYEEVIAVQADGDELALIIDSFKNVPVRLQARVVRWGNPWATFIADNL